MTFKDLFPEGTDISLASIAQLKENGIIPPQHNETFKNNCICGSERMGRLSGDELTMITCVDPLCPIKTSHQMDKIFTKYNIKGIGVATWEEMLRGLPSNIKSVAGILVCCTPELIKLTDKKAKIIADGLELIKSTKITKSEFIERLNYPFKKKTLIEALTEDYENNIKLIQEDTEEFRRKYNITYNLNYLSLIWVISHINYIISSYEKLKIFVPKKKVISIAISGGLILDNERITKENYIKKINTKLSEIYNKYAIPPIIEFKRTDSMTEASSLIVSEKILAEGSAKLSAAISKDKRIRAENPEKRFIHSAKGFLEVVDKQLEMLVNYYGTT